MYVLGNHPEVIPLCSSNCVCPIGSESQTCPHFEAFKFGPLAFLFKMCVVSFVFFETFSLFHLISPVCSPIAFGVFYFFWSINLLWSLLQALQSIMASWFAADFGARFAISEEGKDFIQWPTGRFGWDFRWVVVVGLMLDDVATRLWWKWVLWLATWMVQRLTCDALKVAKMTPKMLVGEWIKARQMLKKRSW